MSSHTTMIISPTYGQFLFDAVFNTSHSSSVTATKHPVQTGASVSDHAILEPDEVSLDIGMSDVAYPAYGAGSRSVNAFAQLKAIMERREPVTLVTRLGSYKDMLIVAMSAPDDYKTMHALRATIQLSQIRIVSVATLTVRENVTASKSEASQGNEGSSARSSSSGAKTAAKNSSTKSQTNPDKSVLKRLADSIRG